MFCIPPRRSGVTSPILAPSILINFAVHWWRCITKNSDMGNWAPQMHTHDLLQEHAADKNDNGETKKKEETTNKHENQNNKARRNENKKQRRTTPCKMNTGTPLAKHTRDNSFTLAVSNLPGVGCAKRNSTTCNLSLVHIGSRQKIRA